MTSPIAGEREAPLVEKIRAVYEEWFFDKIGPETALCSIGLYLSEQRAALLEPVGEGWVMVPKELAERLYADAKEVFDADGPETPQCVRDVIEWFAASLREAKCGGGSK